MRREIRVHIRHPIRRLCSLCNSSFVNDDDDGGGGGRGRGVVRVFFVSVGVVRFRFCCLEFFF